MKKAIFFFLCSPFLLFAQSKKSPTIAEVTANAEITDSLTGKIFAIVQLEMIFENKGKKYKIINSSQQIIQKLNIDATFLLEYA